MIKVGRYQGRVVDAVLGLDSIGGEQIEILIEVPLPQDQSERVSFIGSFSGEAAHYTLDRMFLAGFQIGADPDVMNGAIVELVVFEEVYKNKPRIKVDIVKPMGELQTPQARRITGKKAADFLSKIASQPRPPRKAAHSNLDEADLPPEAFR